VAFREYTKSESNRSRRCIAETAAHFILIMETKEFRFNESVVEFEVSNKNVMVNATEMANVFGKKPDDFLKTEPTEAVISECCKDENYYELLGLKKGVQVEYIRLENLKDRKKQFLKVVHGGRNNCTKKWLAKVKIDY
jgi:hypothetical protein